MYNNISQKKFLSLLMVSFLALNFVSFASQIAILIGTDGIIPLFVSGGVMYIFSILSVKLMISNKGKSFYDILTGGLGKFVGSILYLFYIVVMIYLYSYAVRIIATQVSVYMLPGKSMYVIYVVFISITLYAIIKGLAAIGNFSRIILYPIVFMLIFLFFLSVNNMDILNMFPLFTSSPGSYLNAVMHLLSYNFSGAFCIPFIVNNVYDIDEKSISREIGIVFLTSFGIFCVYYVLCIGVLGVDTCRSIVFPAINIMHNSTSSGIFLNRYEIIIVFIVIILYFLYCAVMMFSSVRGIYEITEKTFAGIFTPAVAVVFVYILNDRAWGEYIARILHMRGLLGYFPIVMTILFIYLLRRNKSEKSV